MKKLMIILMIFTVGILSAQSLNLDVSRINKVYLRASIEPTSMVTAGYQRDFFVPKFSRNISTYCEWSSTMFTFGMNNSEFKLGGIAPLYGYKSFMVINNLNFSTGRISTRNFDSQKFAFSDEFGFGLYKQNWLIAFTAEYEKIMINYIEHTKFYRNTYYEDAKDGWYKGCGGMFQFGLDSSITLWKNYEFDLKIKLPFTEKFNNYGGSPLHLSFSMGYRF